MQRGAIEMPAIDPNPGDALLRHDHRLDHAGDGEESCGQRVHGLALDGADRELLDAEPPGLAQPGRDQHPCGAQPRAGHEHRALATDAEQPATDDSPRERPEVLRRGVHAEGRPRVRIGAALDTIAGRLASRVLNPTK